LAGEREVAGSLSITAIKIQIMDFIVENSRDETIKIFSESEE